MTNFNDTDFEQFIKLLDGALASDDKNVRNALKKFLFVAALALGDDCEPGPFTEMMETIDNLQQRISTLELKDNSTYVPNPGTSNPWIYTQPTVYPANVPGTATNPQWYQFPGGTTTTITGGSSTGTSTSTGTITTLGTTSSATTFPGTASATSGYSVFSEDISGTRIKDSIVSKLKELVKTA